MDYWSGVLDWTTGGAGPLRTHAQNVARLSAWEQTASWCSRRCLLYLVKSPMAEEADLQLGTENDPIITQDNSPAGNVRPSDPQLLRSPVKILEGNQYRYAHS